METLIKSEVNSDKLVNNDDIVLNVEESRLELSSWGLPEPVLKHYARMGITKMFDWQAECLCTGGVLGGGNLVYSAPTSAGKTMVAELLILKQVLENKRKALFILPFVSVAREKMFSLQKLYQDAGIRVSGFMGSYNPPGGFSNIDVAVCTIEKGNSLINKLLQEDRLKELGTIVIDELHMVGDSNRGYLLELLLTKVCYVAKKMKHDNKNIDKSEENAVQIIGMSATLPNLPLLARWLSADLYVTEYRPVPLTECIKLGTEIFNSNLDKISEVNKDFIVPGDDEHIVPLCLQTLLNSHSVLIFCPTRNWCEKLCETIAREFYKITKCYQSQKVKGFTNLSDFIKLPLDFGALNDIKEQLQRTPTGLDGILGKTVPYGVAYHHAGLTFDERDIIEGAFKQCQLKVLVATSTLSSGVNLPARRVIIRTPIFHGQVIDTLVYKQMVGRAGRKGVDTEGESIIICKHSEKSKVLNLLQTDLPPVKSCLIKDNELSTSLKRAILEVVAGGLALSPRDVADYAACTMLSASLTNGTDAATSNLIDSCLDFLQDNEFVALKKTAEGEDRFCPSQLGVAVLASALSPDEGLMVFADLQKARKCFVLESELHVIFLVTPIYSQELSSNIDWYQFYEMFENLSPDMKRVAELVGVEETFIARAIRGRILTKTSQHLRSLAIHRRFYTAMVLHELVNEKSLNDIIKKYNCNKGQLSSLQQSSATFAGMVTVFCGKLGWHNLELILSQFQNRLTFGVQRELCDLVRITALNAQRARCLYNGGFQTVAALANADPNAIETIFLSSMAFQSNKIQEGESEWEAEKRRKCRCIWLGGRKAVTLMEAAVAVVEEAKEIIQQELGGVGIQWAAPATSNQLNESSKSNQSFSFITPTGRARTSKKKAGSSSGKRKKKNRRSKKGLLTSPSSQDAKGLIKRIVLSPPIAYIRSKNASFNVSGNLNSNIFNSSKLDDSLNMSGKHTTENNDIPMVVNHSNQGQSTSHKSDQEHINCHENRPEQSTSHPSQSKQSTSHPSQSKQSTSHPSQSKLSTSHQSQSKQSTSHQSQPEPSVSHQNCQEQSTIHQNRQENLSSHQNKPEQFSNPLNRQQLPQIHQNRLEQTSNEHPAIYHKKVQQPANSGHTGLINSNKVEIYKSQSTRLFNLNEQSKNMVYRPEQSTINSKKQEQSRTSLRQVVSIHNTRPIHRINPASTCKQDQSTCSIKIGVNSKPEKMDEHTIQPFKQEKINMQTGNKKQEQTSNKSELLGFSQCASRHHLGQSQTKSHLVQQKQSICHQDRCEQSGNILNKQVESSSTSDKQLQSRTCQESSANVLDNQRQSNINTHIKHQQDKSSLSSFRKESEQATNHYQPNRIIDDNIMSPELCNKDTSLNESDLNMLDINIPDVEQACVTKSSVKKISVPIDSSYILDSNHSIPCPVTLGEASLVTSDYERGNNEGAIMNDSLFENSYLDLQISCPTPSVQLPSNENHFMSDSKFQEDMNIMLNDTFDISTTNVASAEIVKQSGTPAVTENRKSCTPKIIENKPLVENGSTPLNSEIKHEFMKTSTPNIPENRTSIKNICKSESRLLFKATNGSNANENIPSVKLPSNTLTDSLTFSMIEKALDEELCEHGGNGHEITNSNSEMYSTPQRQIQSYNRSSRKRRSTEGNAGHRKENKIRKDENHNSTIDNSSHNVSNGSDVVPPTPPDQKSVVMSPCLRKTQKQSRLDKSVIVDTVEYLHRDRDLNCVISPDKNVSNLTQTQQSFTIMDVCSNRLLFQTFMREWNSKKRFSLCVACEPKTQKPVINGGIGIHLSKNVNEELDISINGEDINNDERVIVGIGVSWENRDVYYLALSPSNIQDDPNDTLLAFSIDQGISLDEKLTAIKTVLESPDKSWIGFDIKSQYSVIARGCGIVPMVKVEDPQIACWLLDPDAKEKNIHGMVTNMLPNDVMLLHGIGGSEGNGSLGLLPHRSLSGRYRAATESVLALRLMDCYLVKLVTEKLLTSFTEVEMPSIITLARMELNGFGFSDEECEHQKKFMTAKLSHLETDAYKLAGHPFCLTSTDDIAQVLYLDLHLPVNGDTSAQKIKTLGPNRRTAKRTKSHYSTSKEILEKLRSHHPLPGIILEWRRISSTLTKQVFPLQREKLFNKRVNMDRIYGVCQVQTATGRVSMKEPNIQNVPKDFEIEVVEAIDGRNVDIIHETRSSRMSSKMKKQQVAVSMRHTFIPFKGCVTLAADYSQLELRVIAHLSADVKLLNILNKNEDVFKQIAAQWLNLLPEDVNTDQRQQAKQICYGMLYGIGPKALGEQIGVDENDAGVFMETFKSKYPGLRKYLQTTIENCKRDGYVKTILGRRRYLPSIKSTNSHARSQAERQSVNTTVQGSAADIVKTAMNNIDYKLQLLYPDTKYPHNIKITDKKKISLPRGAFLLLQLHDELIYEVSCNDVDKVCRLVTYEMENAVKLSVQLQVKVKTGKSWGSLQNTG